MSRACRGSEATTYDNGLVRKPSDDRASRRRLAGSLVGAGLDEVFNPSARLGREVWEAQVEASAPALSPGEPPDLDSGRITITLPQDRSP